MAKKKHAAPAGPPPSHFFQKELAGEPPVSFETASGLCREAARLLEAEPWKQLDEDQLVFAAWPGTAAPYTCSILGALGEVLALTVYFGAEGYHLFRSLHEGGAVDFDFFIYHVSCLKMEFVERRELTRQDRELLAAINYAARGRAPQFRSQRPGHFPWYVNQDEAVVLQECAAAFLSVFTSDAMVRPGEFPLVTRRADGAYDIESAPPPAKPCRPVPRPLDVDPARIASLAGKTARSALTIEIDSFAGPPIGERGQRPSVGRIALAVDGGSGVVLQPNVTDPKTPLGEALADTLLHAIAAVGARPGAVRVRTAEQKSLLAPIAKSLGFRLAVSQDMPALDMAKDALLSSFLRG